MSDPASIRRQLRIKSGVATRLLKERKMYLKEAEDQRRKLDKFIADGAEDWDIKNATRMMEESNKMIKDSSERLGNAVGDLRAIVSSAKPSLAEDQGMLDAEKALQEAEKALEVTSV